MAKPVISVVTPISTVKYVERLQACLASVRKQSYPQHRIEVLLVYLVRDSVNEDLEPLLKLCEQHAATLIEYRNPEKAWTPSLSRNVGYRRATGQILVSLDADAVLDPRTFKVAERRMRGGKKAVRVRTSLVPYPPGSGLFFDLRPQVFQKSVDVGAKAPGPGCCIMAPRKGVFKIHGWDENFVGYGPADWDFVKRLSKAGYRVINLSKTDGIWTLHQHHERQLGTKRQLRNIAYFNESSQSGDPVRNYDGWGGGP